MLDWWEFSQRFKKYINFSEILTYLSPPVTLKMRSSSPKSNQLLSLSLWYIYVSLEKIYPLAQEISYIQDYDLENGSRSPKTSLKSDEYPSICSYLILAIKATFVNWAVTLKMRPKSPKYSKLFRLSLRYGCASLVRIKTKMQEIPFLVKFSHIIVLPWPWK